MKVLNNYKAAIKTDQNKLPILFKSIVIGLLVGIVVVAYRLTLIGAEDVCLAMYAYLRNHLLLVPFVLILLGGAGYVVGLLISNYEMISGSVYRSKRHYHGYFKDNWLSTLIAKL
jgi:uncharacterized protein YacL